MLPDRDVTEEPEVRMIGDALVHPGHVLYLLVVRRDPAANEPVRCRQALDHVDVGDDVGAVEEILGGIECRRPAADDGDA